VALTAAATAAQAAVNVTITRTSDTLATISLDAGATLARNPAFQWTGFRLHDVFDFSCGAADPSCGYDSTMSASNIISNTVQSNGAAPTETGATFSPERFVDEGFFSFTEPYKPGDIWFAWSDLTFPGGTSALTGTATIDLSLGNFAGLGLTWKAAGSSGTTLDYFNSAPLAGGWVMSSGGGAAAPVPEPETWALLLLGVGGLLARQRNRYSTPRRSVRGS
jgi:hypothetical protein